MSEIARKEFEDAHKRQITENDARRIRTRVEEAQRNPTRAGIRWPFELMQNAHDAGPRDSDDLVKIKFTFKNNELVVSHTGKSFTAQDLAALLSGGSNKGLDDDKTTGRFGTGFLATHALSTHVDVCGVMKTETEGHERFHIELDRGGNEEAIAKNIEQANEAIRKAKPLHESCIANIPTASFTYYETDCSVAQKGLDRLEQALPYLYATCDKLGQVRIERPHGTTLFEPVDTTENEIDGFALKLTEVAVSQGETTRQLTALRIGQNTRSGLLVVLEHSDSYQDRVRLPDPVFPKIFVKFPIAGTDFLPFNVVLDGRFAPQQERDGIAMNEPDRCLVSAAMDAFPTLIQHAVEAGWRDAHKLARLAVPERPLSGESGSGELKWWERVVSQIAKATTAKPIIGTEAGLLPALPDDGQKVSFLVPATNKNGQDRIDYDAIYGLASRVTDIRLPAKRIAQDWDEIARQWGKMGLPVSRLGLEELTDWVKKKGQVITDLPIRDNPFKWLADLFHLTANLPDRVNVRPLVNRLMPDQHSKLRSLNDLRIDDGISDEIKDIADAVGIDLRSKLLHNDLIKTLDKSEYKSAKDHIGELLGEPYSESEAIGEIFAKLDDRLPDDKTFDEETNLPALHASARLAIYLFGKDKDNVQSLRKCPLLTADDTVVRLTNRQILAPVKHWPSSAQPYDSLYVKNSILSSRYFDDNELRTVLQPLIRANLVIPAPLYKAPRPLIDDANLLKVMTPDRIETEGLTVRNQSFGQIAFLATELVNRCGYDKCLAKFLLKFVLNVAAKEDQGWRESHVVNGNRSGEQEQLTLFKAIWPFELKVRSWVPVPIEEEGRERFAPTPANEAHLRELLEPDWLQNNPHAIDLLHRVFGFKRLALMIENLEPDVESNLVKLLQEPDAMKSAVENLDAIKAIAENPEVMSLISEVEPDEIQKLSEEFKKQKQQARMREDNRNFGHAVQGVLAEAIESYGFVPKLVDRGFDYEVSLDDAPFSFDVGSGSYFLEVKATTTGEVRLTPLQAKTASDYPDRFVLCVIDLREPGIPESWEFFDVKPFAKIVTNIGKDISKVYKGVDGFTSVDGLVRLRNEQQLRYGVSAKLWEKGISIDEWIKSLRTKASQGN